MKLEITGIDRVLNDFDEISEEIEKKLYDELVITGLMVESGYKAQVLVDTGRLRSSIWTKHKGNKSFNYSNRLGESFSGNLTYNPKENEVVVGTNVNYAIYVEEKFGNKAFQKAFEKETEGLAKRLKRILK